MPPLPREHGAWGLLLQPFVAAVVLSGNVNWLLLPALAAVLLVFVIREPLLILARQRWIWRDRRPESSIALRWVLIELALLSLCGAALLTRLPPALLAAAGVSAAGLTTLAIWMTIHNRQRSPLLQTVSAIGLSASAVLPAALAWPAPWLWPVWGLHALHATGGIFAVHTRLELRTRQQPPPSASVARAAVAATGTLVLIAALAGQFVYAIPLLVSAGINASELARLGREDAVREPLQRVGMRNLLLSVTFTVTVIVVLRRFAI